MNNYKFSSLFTFDLKNVSNRNLCCKCKVDN